MQTWKTLKYGPDWIGGCGLRALLHIRIDVILIRVTSPLTTPFPRMAWDHVTHQDLDATLTKRGWPKE